MWVAGEADLPSCSTDISAQPRPSFSLGLKLDPPSHLVSTQSVGMHAG